MGIHLRLLSSIIDFSFVFEALFPQFVAVYLNRKLREYREKGILADYEVKAGRKGRGHYVFEVDLFFEDEGGR